jgi:hypothetical protein
MSLLEIAMLASQGRLRPRADEFFEKLQANPLFRILPLSYEIALEVASLGAGLRGPADRAIVATARVHRLRLMTSDQRQFDKTRLPWGMINPLHRLFIIPRLRQKNVLYERLRIAIVKRKPTRLNLHHHPMPRKEDVVRRG